jgi:hypothetical protein
MTEPQPWDAVLGGDDSPPNLDYLVALGLKKIFKLDDSVIEEILSEEDNAEERLRRVDKPK